MNGERESRTQIDGFASFPAASTAALLSWLSSPSGLIFIARRAAKLKVLGSRKVA
jgi:hypothetical protein